MMTGHSGSISEAHFSTDGSTVYSCATDKTVSIWDVPLSQRIRKLKGHTGFVNSIRCTRRGNQTLVSGSDDCTIKIWDPRKRNAVHTLDNKYQVTAVCFNDTGEYVISGSLDNEIKGKWYLIDRFFFDFFGFCSHENLHFLKHFLKI